MNGMLLSMLTTWISRGGLCLLHSAFVNRMHQTTLQAVMTWILDQSKAIANTSFALPNCNSVPHIGCINAPPPFLVTYAAPKSDNIAMTPAQLTAAPSLICKKVWNEISVKKENNYTLNNTRIAKCSGVMGGQVHGWKSTHLYCVCMPSIMHD